MTAEEYSKCILKINPMARVVVWDLHGVLTPKWDSAHIGKKPTLEECESVIDEIIDEMVSDSKIKFISNRQGKRQLVKMGLYDKVKALIDGYGIEAQIDWDSSSGFSRIDQTFSAVKKALNLTDEQEEQFFNEGSKL